MNAPNMNALVAMPDRPIGAILIDEKRLSATDTDRILRIQREHGLRFGDAAIQLGLLREEDIQFALSRQFGYPYVERGETKISPSIVAAHDPFSPQVEALRALRGQLMLRWFNPDARRRALAVVSPEGGEGRSWVAANLAVVFSQLGERTLLIDADLRKPAQHRNFGLDNRSGLSSILSSRSGTEVIQRVPGFIDLSVLSAGAVPPNPLELLARPLLARLLGELAMAFDVIIVDTPPVSRYADALAVAARTGGALMVSRKDASRLKALRGCADAMVATRAKLVGTIMNAQP